jgi:hypothetical protein
MLRFALLICAVAAVGPAAVAASLEGTYIYGGKESVTIKIARGEKEGEFAGIAVGAKSDWHRKQLNQAVLEIKRVGENDYRGRCSAYHIQLSKDMAAWIEVAKAELLDDGSLRCRLKIPDEGSVEILYRRVVTNAQGLPPGSSTSATAPEPEPPAEADEGDLTGLWRAPNGDVTRYEANAKEYVGYVARLSPQKEGFGFRIGEECIRLTRKTRDAYVGTVKVKSEGGRETRWEDIELTATRNTLRYTRHKNDGGQEKGAAVRVRTVEERPPEPKSQKEGQQ